MIAGGKRGALARRCVAAAGLFWVILCVAGTSAFADSGQIVNIKPPGVGGVWTADLSVTSDTCEQQQYGNYCGWYPVAWVVPSASSCSPEAGSYVWVGVFAAASGSQSVVASSFFPPTPPFRICLYVKHANAFTLAAETVYQPPVVPAPTPAPTTPPTPAPAAQEAHVCSDFTYQEEAQDALDSKPSLAPTLDANGDGIACSQLVHQFPSQNTVTYHPSSLGKPEAARVVRHALWKRYADGFTARRGFRHSCGRLSRTRVRCTVAWTTSTRRYRGKVTVWTTVTTTGDRYYHWSIRVHRHRLAPNPPTPSSPNTGGGGGGGGGGCDPNYSGACLDPNASDYDCVGGSGDGPLYTGTVVVVGSDHYGLDRDGDGIGCE